MVKANGGESVKQSQCEDIVANITFVGACLADQTWARLLLAVVCVAQIGLVLLHRHREKLQEQLSNADAHVPPGAERKEVT